jgi:hypothetical protein
LWKEIYWFLVGEANIYLLEAFMIHKRLFSVLFVIFLAGCFPQHKVYYPLDATDTTYSGLRDYLNVHNKLHVVFIHGMGLGRPDMTFEELYSSPKDDEIVAIVHAFGWGNSVLTRMDKSPPDSLVKVFRYEISTNDQGLIFHVINYARFFAFSPETSPYDGIEDTVIGNSKKTLYENDLPLSREGAIGNATLKKGLITWGLADAATFLDFYKRAVITDELAQVLRTIYLEVNPPDKPANGTLCFITQSLGSKVLFDTLAKIYDLNIPREPGLSPPTPFDILGNTQTIYMMANQLPLLELGTEVDQSYEWEELFRGNKGNKIGNTGFSVPDALTLVAYSDPNDLLTYPIVPTIRQFVGERTKLTAIDVMVNNSVSIFGLFGDPLRAHTGHFDNRMLMNYLVEGTK